MSDAPDSIQPTATGFVVAPHMVDNTVIIDVRRDGDLFGTLTAQPGYGASGFYTGFHEIKGDLADLLTKAYEMGRASVPVAPAPAASGSKVITG